MGIRNKVYQDLSPTQRAVTAYAAVNRGDGAEIDRLLGEAPRHRGHGKAIIGMRQALEVYNIWTARLVRDSLMMAKKATSAQSYCEGWLAAGGSPEDDMYCQKRLEEAAYILVAAGIVGELNAVKQAAREWCEKNGVPLETFSGVTSFLPLTKEASAESGEEKPPVDDVMLGLMRSMFTEVKLNW